MRTRWNYVMRVLILCFACLCSGCRNCERYDDPASTKEIADNVNYILKGIVGKCYTREELARMLQIFDNIDSNWSYKRIKLRDGWIVTVPKLQLVTPGEHPHDERTRYEISLLDKDKDGFCQGIKVSVMKEGACRIEEPVVSASPEPSPEPSASAEPPAGHPVKPDTRPSEPTPAEPEPGPAPAVSTPEPQSEYFWHLSDMEIVKQANETGVVHKTVYSAEECKHMAIKSGTVEIPEHKTVVSAFTAICDAPPKDVVPGQEVTLSISMTLDNSNDTYHYGADAAIGFGYTYYGTKYWAPAVEGSPAGCHMDAIGDWGKPPTRIPNATVKGTFPQGDHEGQQLVLTFNACGSQTYWVYKLVKRG